MRLNIDFRTIFEVYRFVVNAIRGTQYNYTSGSIYKALYYLAIPIMIEMIMEGSFALVDTFFVAKLDSEEALATIGIAESYLFIAMSMSFGLSMAVTALVSRRIGEQNIHAAKTVVVQLVILCIIISSVISIPSIFFCKDLLTIMGASKLLIEEGLDYTQIILSFNILIFLLFGFNAIFRAAGQPYIPMKALWYSNIFNIIADPILIFGLGPIPALGLKGAAIATTLGRILAALYLVSHLCHKDNPLHINVQYLKFDKNVIISIARLSVGGLFQNLLNSGSWMILIRIISYFGSLSLATYTLIIRLMVFTILPSWGIALASSTLVGQNLGAQKPMRAEKSIKIALIFNLIIIGIISSICYFSLGSIFYLFTENEMIIKKAISAFGIILCGYLFFAIEMVLIQSFNGAGDTTTPMWINFVCFWVIQIPLAWILSFYTNIKEFGVYWAIDIAYFCSCIISFLLFQNGKWKKTVI